MKNYWIKDQNRNEIITKTQIPNIGNHNIYANYYNLIDAKGIGFKFSYVSNLEIEKLYRKNGFDYYLLEQNNQKELYIFSNEKIEEYIERIVLKLNSCRNESDALTLLLNEMK